MLHLSLWLSFLMNRRLKQHIRPPPPPTPAHPPPSGLLSCHSRMGLVQAVSVQCCFRPKRPYGLLETGSPGRPPRLSHCSWAALHVHQRLFITRKIFGSTLSYNFYRAQWSPGYRKLACPSPSTSVPKPLCIPQTKCPYRQFDTRVWRWTVVNVTTTPGSAFVPFSLVARTQARTLPPPPPPFPVPNASGWAGGCCLDCLRLSPRWSPGFTCLARTPRLTMQTPGNPAPPFQTTSNWACGPCALA